MRGDNDPARSWRHAVAALDRAYPGIEERVGPLLGPPAPTSFEGLVTALADRTEGWAAGLPLAALSLRGQADVTGLCLAFTGSNRYVLDFLAEEVLERQSGQVRTFLLEEPRCWNGCPARCATR